MTLDLAEHYQWMYGDELAESTRLRELLTRLAVENAELRRRTLTDCAFLLAIHGQYAGRAP